MKIVVCSAFLGILMVGCSQQPDNSGYVSGSAPASEQGSAENNSVSEVPNTSGTSTRLNSIVRTNAGPDTGVGAATAASSGVGTATASGSTAIESDAALSKDQNPASPAGTGAQNPTVNSKGVSNAGSSTPQNAGSNR